MGQQISAVIDFGTGAQEASVSITGLGSILATSFAEAFIMAESNAENSVDDHILASRYITLVCTVPVAATGFTVNAFCEIGLKGKYNIKAVWN